MSSFGVEGEIDSVHHDMDDMDARLRVLERRAAAEKPPQWLVYLVAFIVGVVVGLVPLIMSGGGC